jgi:serine/threonine-protein kinase
MNPFERWNQIKEILNPALEMAAAEGSSFLDEKCGTDDDLRREIESLIAAHDAGDHLESPAVERMAAVVSDEEADGMVGRSLGHYEVIEKLGAGGMGEVCTPVTP